MSWIGKTIAMMVGAACVALISPVAPAQARIIQQITQMQESGQTVTAESLAQIAAEAYAAEAASEPLPTDSSQEAQLQSAQSQTATETTRSAVQATSAIISTRLEVLNQPQAGGPEPGGAAPQNEEQSPGVPTPSKDSAALSTGAGGMLAANKSFSFGMRGLSAGQDEQGADRRIGLWGMGAVSWTGNNQSGSSFNGNIYNVMVGLDYKFLDALTAGLAVGYEGTNTRTWYNDGNIYGNGFTVMPYASYALTSQLIFDASFGLTFSQYRSNWRDAASLMERSRDYGAFRVMGAANLAYYIPVQAWLFKLNAGTILANENSSYLSGANANQVEQGESFFGELAAGGTVKYSFDRFSARLGATYRYDYALKDDNQDRDEVQGVLGVDFTPRDDVMVDLQVSNSFFRDNVNNTTLNATFRLEY